LTNILKIRENVYKLYNYKSNVMKAIFVILIAVASMLSTLAVLSIGLQTAVPLSSSTAVAQPQSQQVEENATVHSNATQILNLSTGNKTFYEINQEIEDFNETKMGFPSDVFARPLLVVNKGDNVTIHFFNVESDATDRHSFTLGAPYNVDKDLAGGENATAKFTANQEGVFIFYCKYHLPTMTGELVVLPNFSQSSP
jgi:plastocyanin